MSIATARRERQDAVLAELSELGLSLARDLHARALAVESAQDADKLALAFQRVSRGVRQTFALELKIERERKADDREAEQAAREAAEAALARARPEPAPIDPALAERRARIRSRRDRVTAALNRLIWTEAERDEEEYEVLIEDLEARLDEAQRREDFLDLPLEALILQLKADMDLSGDLRLTACTAPRPDPPPRTGDLAPDIVFDAAPPNTG